MSQALRPDMVVYWELCDGLNLVSRNLFLKLKGLNVLTFSELQTLSSKLLLQGSNKFLLDFLSLWRTTAALLSHVQLVHAYLPPASSWSLF